MKLVMGVVEVPYDDTGKTTGDVAGYLEDKYGVMQTYWDRHGQEIGDALASSLMGALESVAMGGPPTLDPTGTAMSATKHGFTNFITLKEMDALVPGVPTQASLDGVSHRFKGKKGAPGRPSFVDTGAYVGSFKSWIETD